MRYLRIPVPLCASALTLMVGLLGALPAAARSRTFDLTYSGADFNNTATATAVITIDESQIQNPGFTEEDLNPFVTAFSITVSGAAFGNGTFGLNDFLGGIDTSGFDGFPLDTNGGTLDLTQSLIGQPTSGSPYGTTFDGTSGDFAIIANGEGERAGAPVAGSYFQIYTNGSANGYQSLHLTSFRPAPVPEASTTASFGFLLALGLGGVMAAKKRRAA